MDVVRVTWLNGPLLLPRPLRSHLEVTHLPFTLFKFESLGEPSTEDLTVEANHQPETVYHPAVYDSSKYLLPPLATLIDITVMSSIGVERRLSTSI